MATYLLLKHYRPVRHLPVDHPGRTQLRHGADPVSHLTELSWADPTGADAARGWRALWRPATPEHWPDSRPPTGFPGIRAKDSRSLVLRFNTTRLLTQELG